jgi:Pyruvate/2-oxoacid:ferredoxin oxidoreductase gamma subunit
MVLLGATVSDKRFPLSKDSIMKDNLKSKFHDMNIQTIENGFKGIKSI